MTAPLKADVTAADRLLKAAVRRAVEMIRGWQPCEPMPGYDIASVWTPYDEAGVVDMLTTATHAADLLLADDERPAKKAAARKGASS